MFSSAGGLQRSSEGSAMTAQQFQCLLKTRVCTERQRRGGGGGDFFHSVKGGSLWTAGVYEVLSLSWRHDDTHTHTDA